MVLDDHVRSLPRAAARVRSSEERLSTAMLTRVRLSDISALSALDSAGRRGVLVDHLAQVADDMRMLADTLSRQYLSHTQAARRLGGR